MTIETWNVVGTIIMAAILGILLICVIPVFVLMTIQVARGIWKELHDK